MATVKSRMLECRRGGRYRTSSGQKSISGEMEGWTENIKMCKSRFHQSSGDEYKQISRSIFQLPVSTITSPPVLFFIIIIIVIVVYTVQQHQEMAPAGGLAT